MEQSCTTPDAGDCKFPNEIWDKIFLNLPSPDLVSTARVNHGLHAISVRILYRSIRPTRSRSFVSCLKTLCQNGLLASLVRIVQINWQRTGFHSHPTGNLYRLLNQALRRLHRLEVLSLQFIPQHSTRLVSLSYIFEGCSFRLTTLRVTLHHDTSFANFLASQLDIVNLSISGNLDAPGLDFALPPHALPRLAYLCAPMLPMPVLKNIVRGRCVHHIEFDYGLIHWEAEIFETLLLSKVPITRLLVRWPHYDLVDFEKMVKFMRHVQWLTLHTLLSYSMFYDMHEHLSELSALTTLELYSLGWTEEAERDLALCCFQHCSTLMVVQFHRSTWCKGPECDLTINRFDGNLISPQLWWDNWCY